MSNANIAAIEEGPFAGSLDYPFVGQADLSSPVIDAKVFFNPEAVTLPFYVHGSISAGGVVSASLQDETGSVVLALDNGTRTQFHTDGPNGHYIAVFANADLQLWLELDSAASATSTQPERLDARTYKPKLPSITELRLLSCDSSAYANPIAAGDIDHLQIQEGNNVVWAGDGDRLNVNLGAGLGLGKVDNCSDQTDAIYTVAGVEPVNGNLVLNKNDCYRIEPEFEVNGSDQLVMVPGKLRFFQDCEPCCDCNEYEAVALAVQRQNRINDYISERFNEAASEYNEIVNSVNRGFDLLPNLTLAVGRGNECQISISATYTNSSALLFDAPAFRLTLEDDSEGDFVASRIQGVPAAAAIYCDGTYLTDRALSQLNGYTLETSLGRVEPKQSVTIAMTISVLKTARYRVCVSITNDEPSEPPTCQEVAVICS